MYIKSESVNDVLAKAKEKFDKHGIDLNATKMIDRNTVKKEIDLDRFLSKIDTIAKERNYKEGQPIDVGDMFKITNEVGFFLSSLEEQILRKGGSKADYNPVEPLMSATDYLYAITMQKLGCPKMPASFGSAAKYHVGKLATSLKSKMTLNLYRKEWEDELEIDYEIINKISPIEKHEGILVKRNDLLEVGEVNGLKVMGCLYLIQKALKAGKKGFITLGSRTSPQCNILSFLCSVLEVPCHLFMADSKDNSEIQDKIERRDYSEIHRVKCGYNNVLKANAQKYAQEHPELEFLPFGLESDDVMLLLSHQVENIPPSVKHITIPVGGANNISALLWGLYKAGRTDISVTGVITGADASSIEYLEKHLPPEHGKYEIVKYRPELNASERYLAEQPAKIGDIQLHPTYEGKCRNFIKWEYGDTELFWIVGGPQK